MATPVRPLPRKHVALLAAFVLILALSCIAPPYPHELALQHIPTLLALAILIVVERRYPLSDASFSFLLIFMLIHVVGARWIYSYVPYDEWARSIAGVSITEIFGFKRNHYDRFVHLSYGILFSYIAHEIFVRRFKLRDPLAYYIALEFIMASSMLYELFEWLIAILLSPDAAEAYNGQQGDMWDSQKDMALATIGAIITIGIVAIRNRRTLRR
jgi:putative membrane protein